MTPDPERSPEALGGGELENLVAQIYDAVGYDTTIFYYGFDPLWEAVADEPGADILTSNSILGQGQTLNEALGEVVRKVESKAALASQHPEGERE